MPAVTRHSLPVLGITASKPVAITGAAPGAIGTARAQALLELVLLSALAPVLPHPGVVVGGAREKFDGERNPVDGPTLRFLASFLQDLEMWTRRVSAPADELQEVG